MMKKSVTKPTRPAFATSPSGPQATGAHALTLHGGWEPDDDQVGVAGSEHRQFPRARLRTRFELWIDVDGERRFSASLDSINLSVSGAFLESTFFLPLGTEVRVRFGLDESEQPVEARASIVREERGARGGEGRMGLGLRFEEFFGQSEVTLAKLFLGVQLRAFATEYLASDRAQGLGNELDRVVDALAAWELLKVTTPEHDPWRAQETKAVTPPSASRR